MYEITVCVLIVLIVLYSFYVLLSHHEWGEWWEEWHHHPVNFSFKYKGKTLWYSRSCAVASFIFAKDENNEWCVLANQRGKGAADFQGLWNCPCGYLDWNETCAQAARREVFEETGVPIPPQYFTFAEIQDDPNANRQNVTMRFYAKITEHKVEHLNPKLTGLGEENEVAERKWIPISQIGTYKWAFDHGNIILSIYNRFIK